MNSQNSSIGTEQELYDLTYGVLGRDTRIYPMTSISNQSRETKDDPKDITDEFYIQIKELIDNAAKMVDRKIKKTKSQKKKDAATYLNTEITSKLLDLSAKFNLIKGERDTLKDLTKNYNPFDNSTQKMLFEKDKELHLLRHDVTFTKEKLSQTEKTLDETRQIYEKRRESDYNTIKRNLDIINDEKERNTQLLEEKQALETSVSKMKLKTKKLNDKTMKLNELVMKLGDEIDDIKNELKYQKSKKIKARRKMQTLKEQASSILKDIQDKDTLIEKMQKCINGLNRTEKYKGVINHFTNFFPNNVECSLCSGEIKNDTDGYMCNVCKIHCHLTCIEKTKTNRCCFCTNIMENIGTLIEKYNNKNTSNNNTSNEIYESDGDDEYDFEIRRSQQERDQIAYQFIYTNINDFRNNMFKEPVDYYNNMNPDMTESDIESHPNVVVNIPSMSPWASFMSTDIVVANLSIAINNEDGEVANEEDGDDVAETFEEINNDTESDNESEYVPIESDGDTDESDGDTDASDGDTDASDGDTDASDGDTDASDGDTENEEEN